MRVLGPRQEAAYVSDEVTTTMACRLVVSNGVTVGLTTNERGFLLDGVVYHAARGLRLAGVNDIDLSIGLTISLSGLLLDPVVNVLRSALFDRHVIQLAIYSVIAAPTPIAMLVVKTTVEATFAGSDEIQLRARREEPRLPTSELSTECRAELGDHSCRVALRRFVTRVVAGLGSTSTDLVIDDASIDLSPFVTGRVRVRARDGAMRQVKCVGSLERTLLLDPPLTQLRPGLKLELVAGCDKRLATCSDTYNNVHNFRGLPFAVG